MSIRSTKSPLPGFREVPRTGVIYVMTRAKELGYSSNSKEWTNLGQGAPETSEIPNAPKRVNCLNFCNDNLEYAPVDGLHELKVAVAQMYNKRYRLGKESQYTADNVAICAGGRTALTRIVSTLGHTNIGHFLPDYTAYEELLGTFGSFVSIPILLDAENNYEISIEELRKEILGRGFTSLLLSNPSNPTGKLIYGKELEAWVNLSREVNCCLIIDEFYSHYIYQDNLHRVSAAEYVENVETDPIIIVDGLTKNWRYPGFRVSWTLGPSSLIEAVASAGSFLDGGCAQPMQLAAVNLANIETADAEAKAINSHFKEKRKYMLSRLKELNIKVEPAPQGAFYCWADISNLPDSINDGMKFFEACLKNKVITVPGEFFDINPGHRRADRPSRFRQFIRFSFGPSLEELKLGLDNIEKTIKAAN